MVEGDMGNMAENGSMFSQKNVTFHVKVHFNRGLKNSAMELRMYFDCTIHKWGFQFTHIPSDRINLR